MAIAIKNIPILTGAAAERFIEMADANKGDAITCIPEEMRQSIRRMAERSSKFQIKKPN